MNASLYAKPVIPRIVFRPALATLVLHGLLFTMLIANWDFGEREILRVKPVPKSINATLVDASDLLPKPAPPPKAQPKPKPAPRPEPRQPVQPKVEAKPKPVPKPAPKPAPKPVPKPAPQPQVEARPEPKVSPADLVAMMQNELAETAAAEQQATADELSSSFAGIIRQTVVGYWSRPPSARNGMEAELEIQLIPTGEVVNVVVITSSGNLAFDRSAVSAVKKAGSFPELQKLPSNIFERDFRRLRLIFRPEDLRY